MKKLKKTLMGLLIILFFASPLHASTLFLEDWGVSPADLTPDSIPPYVKWTVEDFTGPENGFVDPGWGGQLFDAEAAYIGFKNSKIYLAIVTGMPQSGAKDPWRYDNPKYNFYDWNRKLEKYWYDPGDIAIDLVNVGGENSYEFAITTRMNNIHSSYAPTPGAGMLLSGNLLWENPRAWDRFNKYTDWNGISDPWAVTGYDRAVDLGESFRYSYLGEGHYAIEALLDISLLGLKGPDILNMHWVMECGNDNINLAAEIPAPVPEPSTLLLLGSGLAGVAFYRKRNGNKRDK